MDDMLILEANSNAHKQLSSQLTPEAAATDICNGTPTGTELQCSQSLLQPYQPYLSTFVEAVEA